jgi:hypothetical protein
MLVPMRVPELFVLINTKCLTGMIFAFGGAKVSVLGYPDPLKLLERLLYRVCRLSWIYIKFSVIYISSRNLMEYFVQNGNGKGKGN